MRLSAWPSWTRVCLTALVSATWFGCAGHSGRTDSARKALDRGQPQDALADINEELKVEDAQSLPAKAGGDNALLLLERGTLLQALRRHKLSSRDYQVADKQIELLDFSRKGISNLGRYMYSDDTGAYRAPAYEKLMINALNMANYLSQRELQGARVEARRFTTMKRFVTDQATQDTLAVAAFGSYLAGFAFEMSGRYADAARFYRDAVKEGSFLHARQIADYLDQEGTSRCHAPQASCATLLVIFGYGRMPAKEAERVPIGLALTYAAGYMSPNNYELAGQGLVTWVNYPQMNKPRWYNAPSLWINGQRRSVSPALQLDHLALRTWDKAKGAVMASAITRALSRVAVGQTTRHVVGDNALGIILGLGSQAALSAADTPDTRSWSTLPARLRIARIEVPAGKHAVLAQTRGESFRATVNLKPRTFRVITLFALR